MANRRKRVLGLGSIGLTIVRAPHRPHCSTKGKAQHVKASQPPSPSRAGHESAATLKKATGVPRATGTVRRVWHAQHETAPPGGASASGIGATARGSRGAAQPGRHQARQGAESSRRCHPQPAQSRVAAAMARATVQRLLSYSLYQKKKHKCNACARVHCPGVSPQGCTEHPDRERLREVSATEQETKREHRTRLD